MIFCCNWVEQIAEVMLMLGEQTGQREGRSLEITAITGFATFKSKRAIDNANFVIFLLRFKQQNITKRMQTQLKILQIR